MIHTLTSPFIEDHPPTLVPWALKFDNIITTTPESIITTQPATVNVPPPPPPWDDEPIVVSPMITSPKETPMTDTAPTVQVERKEAAVAKVKAAAAAKTYDKVDVAGVLQVAAEAFEGNLELTILYAAPEWKGQVYNRDARKMVPTVVPARTIKYRARVHAFGRVTLKDGTARNYVFISARGEKGEWRCLMASRITSMAFGKPVQPITKPISINGKTLLFPTPRVKESKGMFSKPRYFLPHLVKDSVEKGGWSMLPAGKI